jgi:predicted AAA+ superfamily ATPase
VVIDEVQKAPGLLDEVHGLIESRRISFALCGSSARKVRRAHANLLGGRAVSYELFPLVSQELGDSFELVRALRHGLLPRHYLADSPGRMLRAYVQDYLREEIVAEATTRRLPPFAAFLDAVALADGGLVNFATIGRDIGVSAPTVREYHQILVDTLLGRFLPAHTKRPKRRVIAAPKFYLADVGVAGHLARRGAVEPGSEAFGHAFESWVFHELSAYVAYRDLASWTYWRLAGGTEVDFLTEDRALAVEAKATGHVHGDHLRGLRALAVDHRVGRRVVVSLEPRARRTDDGIEILPWRDFTRRLWSGGLYR